MSLTAAELDPDIVVWFRDLGVGLVYLVALQLLAGFWVASILCLLGNRSPARLPLALGGLALIARASAFIFDPVTHLVPSCATGAVFVFSAPLRAAQLLLQSRDKSPPLRYIIATVSFPSAQPTHGLPPTSPAAALARGSALIALTVMLSRSFPWVEPQGAFVRNCWYNTFLLIAAWGVLSISSALFGFVSGVSPARAFNNPWGATSLGAFWAAHWNMPFSQALRQGICEPLTTNGKSHRALAVLLSFAASGLAHEIVLLFGGISIGESRGEWMVFFLLHGIGVLVEKRMEASLKQLSPFSRWLLTAVFNFLSVWFFFVPVTVRLGLLPAALDNLGMVIRLVRWSPSGRILE